MNDLIKEDLKIESDYFGTKDILSLIENNMSISNLMETIEDKYTEDFISKTGKECLFEYISGDELSDYLSKRYKDKLYIVSNGLEADKIVLRKG